MSDKMSHSHLIGAVCVLSVCCLALSAATLALLVDSRKTLGSSSGAHGGPLFPSSTTYPWLSLPTAPMSVVASIQGVSVVFRSDNVDEDDDGILDEVRIYHHMIQRVHQINKKLALLFLDDGTENFVSVDNGLVLYHINGDVMDASAGGGFMSSIVEEWEWDAIGIDANTTANGNGQRQLFTIMRSNEAFSQSSACTCAIGGAFRTAYGNGVCGVCSWGT